MARIFTNANCQFPSISRALMTPVAFNALICVTRSGIDEDFRHLVLTTFAGILEGLPRVLSLKIKLILGFILLGIWTNIDVLYQAVLTIHCTYIFDLL